MTDFTTHDRNDPPPIMSAIVSDFRSQLLTAEKTIADLRAEVEKIDLLTEINRELLEALKCALPMVCLIEERGAPAKTRQDAKERGDKIQAAIARAEAGI